MGPARCQLPVRSTVGMGSPSGRWSSTPALWSFWHPITRAVAVRGLSAWGEALCPLSLHRNPADGRRAACPCINFIRIQQHKGTPEGRA
jgi:hypothetical protein